MTPTPQAIENAARAMSSSKAWPVVFEAGSALILAKAALSCDLGDMVLVPREATVEMVAAFWRQKNTGTQELGSWGTETSDFDAYRAMIAAAEDER